MVSPSPSDEGTTQDFLIITAESRFNSYLSSPPDDQKNITDLGEPLNLNNTNLQIHLLVLSLFTRISSGTRSRHLRLLFSRPEQTSILTRFTTEAFRISAHPISLLFPLKNLDDLSGFSHISSQHGLREFPGPTLQVEYELDETAPIQLCPFYGGKPFSLSLVSDYRKFM